MVEGVASHLCTQRNPDGGAPATRWVVPLRPGGETSARQRERARAREACGQGTTAVGVSE